MSPKAVSPDERDEVEMLLPWYEDGTLEEPDRRRVDAVLASDPELRGRLALIREEKTATVDANEMAGAPGAGALDRLMASIEAESGPELVPSRGGGWLSRLFGAPMPAGMQWAGAAAAIVIVLQAAALGYLASSIDNSGARYETASGDAVAQKGGTFALVRFADDATAARIAEFLSELDMDIVDGPKPGGVYTIRLSGQALGESERDALLKKMVSNQMLIEMAVAAE